MRGAATLIPSSDTPMQISSLYERKQPSGKCELKVWSFRYRVCTMTCSASLHPSHARAAVGTGLPRGAVGGAVGTLAWASLEWGPPQPRMQPEGRTSEDAKFHGRLYPSQVVVGVRRPGPPGTKGPTEDSPFTLSPQLLPETPLPTLTCGHLRGGVSVQPESLFLDQLCLGPAVGGWQQGQVVLAGMDPKERRSAQAVSILQ